MVEGWSFTAALPAPPLSRERPVLPHPHVIGLDDLIIPNLELRAAILTAHEAASVLALLLRAEALMAAGRVALYDAPRFLEALRARDSQVTC